MRKEAAIVLEGQENAVRATVKQLLKCEAQLWVLFFFFEGADSLITCPRARQGLQKKNSEHTPCLAFKQIQGHCPLELVNRDHFTGNSCCPLKLPPHQNLLLCPDEETI